MTRPLLTLTLLLLGSPALALDFADDDNDGYTSDVDCDDNDPDVHPGADEVCDYKDNDCDELIDSDDDNYMPPPGTEQCTGVPPEDADGDGVYTPDDCDDNDETVYPGHPELCDDIDHDCDGEAVPDIDSSGPAYRDIDGDGYGDVTTELTICGEPPAGWVWNADDCDDVNAAAYPGATEICDDGIDQDCDTVDEPCPDPLDSDDTSQNFPGEEDGGAGCVGSGTGSMYASLFLPLLLLRRRRS